MTHDAVKPHRPHPGRRRVMIFAAVALAIVIVAAAGFLIWAMTPLGPSEHALEALQPGDGVRVEQVDGGWLFVPAQSARRLPTGIVLYPGGRVDARSYAPLAREIAAHGHTVILTKMPLSLAVLDAQAASSFVDSEAYPWVLTWAIGGHSLGGAIAAQYAAEHPEVDGLVLLAAYAAEGADLSARQIDVLDVVGTNDEVLTWESWEAGQARLPRQRATIKIEGGNHAQFGSYGPQRGDGTATIDEAEQRDITVDAIDALLGGM